MNKVYITASGTFLPNAPVSNEEMEHMLGKINGNPSRRKSVFLRKNGIKSRYYAIDKTQKTTHKAYEMAASAIRNCLDQGGISEKEIGFLSAGTTQSDLPVPVLPVWYTEKAAWGVVVSHRIKAYALRA